jgi:hydroxyacylglutathione hydrolase
MWIEYRKRRFLHCALTIFTLSLSHCASQSTSASDDLINLETVDWIHGAENCERLVSDANYQQWQQIQFQPQSFVFRQNKCSHYEGPFVYLFVGQERGLLIDSGATITGGLKLVELVRNITDLPILLAHTHGHSDHRLGDDAFRNAEGMSIVGVGVSSVQNYFGFTNWPNEPTTISLGDREVELLPIPGHSDDDVAFYDAQSKIVVTGDTLYPGRLYVSDWLEYRKSIIRLADWVEGKVVSFVMGTHIEMSATPNSDYPIGTTYQPNEHQLPLTVADIYVLRESMELLESAEKTALGSFIIWPN